MNGLALTAGGERAMGSRFHPRLAAWFEDGLASGQFKVPNGRHIVLNEFPRLMRDTRLQASAGVDTESLREFFISINPDVVTIADGTQNRMRQQLATERDHLPALRRVFVPVLPTEKHEFWYIYTPPLAVMRQSWAEIRSKFQAVTL